MDYKVVMLGSGAVGKSAVSIQFISAVFVESYDPTIEDSYRKQVCIDEQCCVLEILDTAGQEEYSAMLHQYIRAGKGFILVYAVNNRTSFDELKTKFYNTVMKVKEVDHVPLVLVANKCDLDASERQVSTQEGEDLAKEWRVPFFETSAKTRKNIDEAFFAIAREIRQDENPDDAVAIKQKKKKNPMKKLQKLKASLCKTV
eukprot:TRINITY_DN182_c0_g1_i2.p1 TRINITY_DN182_c0_g1~~TRINITY_DN182_c0_g1_i2.p1  ORF type:complete len:216 (+),score=45.88 TRINITY_DN182_c0_g1_i2:48-650(+)